MSTPAAAGCRRYEGTWPGFTHQIRHLRAALRETLDGCPLADDALLVVSELAANAAIHSSSRDGGKFTVRLEAHASHIRVEVDDQGGPWHPRPPDEERPHGLELIAAIAGPGNWGIRGDESGRTVWATLKQLLENSPRSLCCSYGCHTSLGSRMEIGCPRHSRVYRPRGDSRCRPVTRNGGVTGSYRRDCEHGSRIVVVHLHPATGGA